MGAENCSQCLLYLALSKVAVVHNCSACYWYRARNRDDLPSPSPDHAIIANKLSALKQAAMHTDEGTETTALFL
ncbi:hypothetical protein N7527_005285 [Penicillium freii]|nr:hypothetical protein N7527_005285 [Penicillium freii]